MATRRKMTERIDSNRSHYPGNVSGTFTPPASHDSEFRGGTIADQVRNSQAYKTAYNLFSSLDDKSWLNRLLAIPTSVQDATSTWFDDYGLSTNFRDKQAANYQYCLQQIQNLMSEYYAWKNSLPITQVDQFQDAGINSAITGQGVDSSELEPQVLSSDPSQKASTDPLSCLQSFVGAMTSLSGGIASMVDTGINMYKQLRDVKRADDKQLFDFFNYLNENGFNIVTSKDGKSIDFSNLLEQYKVAPRKIAGYQKQSKDRYKSGVDMSFWSHIDEKLVGDVMQDFTDLSYKLAMAQYDAALRKSVYERDYFVNLNPGNMAEYDEKTAKYNSEINKLRFENEDKFRTMYWETVDKWKKQADNGSILHQQLLSTLLTGYNPFSFGYNAVVTPIKDAIGLGGAAALNTSKVM